MSEDSFARLNSTMSSFVRSIHLEQEESASRLGAVGPLFHSSYRGQTRMNTRGAGAEPSRTFVWLGQNDPSNFDSTSLEGKRVTFSSVFKEYEHVNKLFKECSRISREFSSFLGENHFSGI